MKPLVLTLAAALAMAWPAPAQNQPRPNILWITCEDTGPHLGCYGDKYSETPNLDGLARKSVIYLHAWSTAPVCAPARTAIISGLYPSATGSEHMRSLVRLPAGFKMYPQFLREAGYYCSNNNKEDYNLEKPGKVWDDSSGKAHWKNRRPGQPFFAIFNHVVTHESQIRKRPHQWQHDPAKVRVPAYHPDTPAVRRDWAQYYDQITAMDALAGKNLRELADAGLAEDTIVFFYGDHGPGMPRSKRWPYNSGLQVGLIVYIPEKFKHLAPKDYAAGGRSERLVAFVDLAPTVLSLAGIKPPDWMQGHAFLGAYTAPEQPYLHGLRGRMDERCDLVRSVRDRRYIYIRNYMPHEIYGQHIAYMFETPTTKIWKQLYDDGKLAPPKTFFWQTKPPEELYDLQADPDEVKNLANSPQHREILARLRQAQQEHALNIRDVGFLPEGEIHSRAQGSSPYELGHDEQKYPLRKIIAAAELASSLAPEALPELQRLLRHPDSAVRHWATLGILMRGQSAVNSSRSQLEQALKDASPYVRINAAEALGRYGTEADLKQALPVLLEPAPPDKNGMYVSLWALNALDALGPKAAGAKDAIQALPRKSKSANARTAEYVPRLIEELLAKPSTTGAKP